MEKIELKFFFREYKMEQTLFIPEYLKKSQYYLSQDSENIVSLYFDPNFLKVSTLEDLKKLKYISDLWCLEEYDWKFTEVNFLFSKLDETRYILLGTEHIKMFSIFFNYNNLTDIIGMACKNNLKTLFKEILNSKKYIDICTICAYHNNLDFLMIALENGFFVNEDTFQEAAKNKNLKILELLIEIECPSYSESGSYVSDDLELLKLLHEYGHIKDGFLTLIHAINNENIECIKYIHENIHPLTEKFINYTLSLDKVDVFKYLDELQLVYGNICSECIINSATKCLKYLNNKGIPIDYAYRDIFTFNTNNLSKKEIIMKEYFDHYFSR